MPSPFPGMDPYLEDPAGWPDTHHGIMGAMRAMLNALLPPRYAAHVEERCYIVEPDRMVVPDLTIRLRLPERQAVGGTAVAVAPEADPSLILKTSPFPVREFYINIVDVQDRGHVVTTIELLSPTNKAAGTKGRRLYRKKQQDVLTSKTHLIEVDLLRAGEHTVAAPREPLLREGRWDYLVSLHRGGQSETIEVWMRTIRDRLPRIAVPLDPSEPDLVLDLQAVFDRNYDEGAYSREIDYTQDPIPPLRPEDAAWADALLKERGLRT